MRFTGPLGYVLSGSAVLALLAGCSGGGGSSSPTPLSPQGPVTTQSVVRSTSSLVPFHSMSTSVVPGGTRTGHPDLSAGFADPDAGATAAIVISDALANTVDVFNTKGKAVATITGFSEPQGLSADLTGNIYVADTVNSQIVEYKNDYKTKLATFADPAQYPAGVDIDSATGVVGVTNIISTAGGAGSVSFYAKGKPKKPCVTVSNSSFARAYFGAFDKSGNFYIDGSNSSGAVVVGVVKGGCAAKGITLLTTKNAITFPGGIQVGATGTIYIDDQSGAAIYGYKPPVKNSLGTPISTTPLTGASDAVTFALNKAATTVWTADAGLAAGVSYKFPAGGAATKSITGFQQPIGVIVTPIENP